MLTLLKVDATALPVPTPALRSNCESAKPCWLSEDLDGR